jgi:hypothetical protein
LFRKTDQTLEHFIAFRLSSEGNCKVHTMARIGALSDKTVGKRLTYKTLTTGAL